MWINSLLWSSITVEKLKGCVLTLACINHSSVDPMDDHDVIGQAELDEEIPTFDVPDDALERAASAQGQAATWVYCTHPWYYCPWPQ
jgi:hypothetical protein